MKNFINLVLFLSFVPVKIHADLFGADIPILAQIAATTAKELKATMELLNVSKDTIDNIKEANTQINTHRETLNRIESLATRAERLSNARVRSHADLNNELRRIRGTLSSSQRMIKDFEKKYGPELEKIEKTQEAQVAMKESADTPMVSQSMVDIRTSLSYNGGSHASHAQNTAINTALTNEILIESTNRQYILATEQLKFINEQRERNLQLQNEQNKSAKFLGGL